MQRIVTTTAALAELAARLEALAGMGLDTEFLRERTYRAELCLIQVSAADDALCIDPIALSRVEREAREESPGAASPFAPLARALTAPGTIKVMHASRQDIEVLFPIAGLVRPVFDTQIAAALIGLPAQVGYAELVRRLLGKELPKTHTRTDWSQRPLSPEQIDYALDDVRYLIPIKSELEERLDKLGRLSWLAEELAALDDVRSVMPEPEQAWVRVKGLGGLDAARVRLARELAAWRERRAIERNRPRGWILDDMALREIVVQVPRSADALGRIKEVPPGVVKHCSADILSCVRTADVPDPPPAMAARPRPDPVKTALVKKLGVLNQAVAADLGLSPEVLATRRDLEQIVEGRRDVGVLRGWRRSVIGDRMLAAL